MTTIKVDSEVRDLLKQQAADADLTLGGYLEYLARQAAKKQRMERLRQQMAATSPEDWESYREETEWWELAQDG